MKCLLKSCFIVFEYSAMRKLKNLRHKIYNYSKNKLNRITQKDSTIECYQ